MQMNVKQGSDVTLWVLLLQLLSGVESSRPLAQVLPHPIFDLLSFCCSAN
jgi:hypothetical protein